MKDTMSAVGTNPKCRHVRYSGDLGARADIHLTGGDLLGRRIHRAMVRFRKGRAGIVSTLLVEPENIVGFHYVMEGAFMRSTTRLR